MADKDEFLWSLKTAVKQGYLIKFHRGLMKVPKMQYFVLMPTGLVWFNYKPDKDTNPVGILPLKHLTSIKVDEIELNSCMLSCMEITSRTTASHCLLAFSRREERNEWMMALMTAFAEALVTSKSLLRESKPRLRDGEALISTRSLLRERKLKLDVDGAPTRTKSLHRERKQELDDREALINSTKKERKSTPHAESEPLYISTKSLLRERKPKLHADDEVLTLVKSQLREKNYVRGEGVVAAAVTQFQGILSNLSQGQESTKKRRRKRNRQPTLRRTKSNDSLARNTCENNVKNAATEDAVVSYEPSRKRKSEPDIHQVTADFTGSWPSSGEAESCQEQTMKVFRSNCFDHRDSFDLIASRQCSKCDDVKSNIITKIISKFEQSTRLMHLKS